MLAGYCYAVRGCDGWGSMPASLGNLIRATAEVNESIFPVRHECCDYATDSGGAGEFRGCPGSRLVKRTLVPAALSTWMVGMKYPMAGAQGGRDGAPNRLTLRFDTDPAPVANVASAEPHAAGEAFEYRYGGGAGFGDPLDREPARVLDDVLDEYVSLAAAEREYGVVFTGCLADYTLAVDAEATRRLRARRRAG